jgi:hypothetical protein
MNCPSNRDGWAVLFGGGSIPDIKLPDQVAKIIPSLKPAENIVAESGLYCLASPHHNYLIYSETIGREITAHVSDAATNYRVHWIDAATGKMKSGDDLVATKQNRLQAKANLIWLEPATK